MSLRTLYRGMRREMRFLRGRAWPLRVRFISADELRRARAFLDGHQEEMLFVMGTGRSGTQLVSDLLALGGRGAVFHEPNFTEDVGDMVRLRRAPEVALRYWGGFRSVEVFRRWQAAPEAGFYAEVNGTIRYQVATIRKLYPRARMPLLVRNGKGVVRSVMGWPQFYNAHSRGAYAIAPLPGDPYRGQWDSMSRFEKVCWSWMDSNEYLMRHIPEACWSRLEDLASDYDYFRGCFVAATGVDIPRETWAKRMGTRSRNATKKYAFPAWDDWSREEQSAFERICGETMRKLGYEV